MNTVMEDTERHRVHDIKVHDAKNELDDALVAARYTRAEMQATRNGTDAFLDPSTDIIQKFDNTLRLEFEGDPSSESLLQINNAFYDLSFAARGGQDMGDILEAKKNLENLAPEGIELNSHPHPVAQNDEMPTSSQVSAAEKPSIEAKRQELEANWEKQNEPEAAKDPDANLSPEERRHREEERMKNEAATKKLLEKTMHALEEHRNHGSHLASTDEAPSFLGAIGSMLRLKPTQSATEPATVKPTVEPATTQATQAAGLKRITPKPSGGFSPE